MKRILTLLSLFFAVGFWAISAHAQPQRKSPHETVSRKLEGNRVTIVYGRPYTKDPRTGAPRKIWGGLVPDGKIWRLGADEATLLITQQPIVLGDATIPAGAYTLFMLPRSDGSAQLIVNREIGQWGIDPYHEQNELARIALTREALSPPVHQLTIALDRGKTGGGVLKVMWEDVQYVAPYRVAK